ncbi:hypothetical protein D3C86_2066960 [compost metagenome]
MPQTVLGNKVCGIYRESMIQGHPEQRSNGFLCREQSAVQRKADRLYDPSESES